MQSFNIMIPDNLGISDIISYLRNTSFNSLYNVFYNEKIESKYDYIVASAHDHSTFLYKNNANILISIISYVPDINDQKWANFYTNLCLTDVIVVDSYNKSILDTYAYPEKRIILIDGVDITSKPQITKKFDDNCYRILNIDANTKLWDKYVEYLTSFKDHRLKITTNPSEADAILAMNPIGYGLTYVMVNRFPFFMSPANDQTSMILDARCIHYLDKRLGPIIEVRGSAFTPQIKEEFGVFTVTLTDILDHLQYSENKLFRYNTNQSLLDRIFHQLNATYTPQ